MRKEANAQNAKLTNNDRLMRRSKGTKFGRKAGRLSLQEIQRRARVLFQASKEIQGCVLLCVEQDGRKSSEARVLQKQLLRSARRHKVLGMVSACAHRKRVKKLMLAAASKKASSVVMEVISTVGWGCPCPPYKINNTVTALYFPEEYLYPVFVGGSKRLSKMRIPGRFKLVGRYSGKLLDRYEWAKKQGRSLSHIPRRSTYGMAYSEKHPEFLVSRWCYHRRLVPRSSRTITLGIIRGYLKKGLMRKSDFCK